MCTEAQLRRLAANHGLRLSKSRTPNPYTGEPVYYVTDPTLSNMLLTNQWGVTRETAKEVIHERS